MREFNYQTPNLRHMLGDLVWKRDAIRVIQNWKPVELAFRVDKFLLIIKIRGIPLHTLAGDHFPVTWRKAIRSNLEHPHRKFLLWSNVFATKLAISYAGIIVPIIEEKNTDIANLPFPTDKAHSIQITILCEYFSWRKDSV